MSDRSNTIWNLLVGLTIVSLLGTGGTSNVYKIKNLKTGKFYTCKKMPLSKKLLKQK